MKLIRLTDDRYLLDAGPDIDQRQMEDLQSFWKDWWKTNTEVPTVVVFGGISSPLEIEDRRLSDVEARLKRLEAHFHKVWRDDNDLLTTREPLVREKPPLGGIAQYQAEDR